jgi:hypothetical protein
MPLSRSGSAVAVSAGAVLVLPLLAAVLVVVI